MLAKCGLDADKLETWRQANVEFMVGKKWDFKIDADLQTLKLSNRKPEFLDWIVARLTKDGEDPLAKKLATRYLGEQVTDPVAFIQTNRKWLFFSDTGGFRWFVDENAKSRDAAAEHTR